MLAMPLICQQAIASSDTMNACYDKSTGYVRIPKSGKCAKTENAVLLNLGVQVGPTGPQGPAGPQGPQGEQGPAGLTGPAGSAGPIGLTGATGATGLTGAQGPAGPAGPAGERGATGPAGPIGLTGATGAIGPAGPAGPSGPAGPIGLTGATGATGLAGAQGPVGPAGPQGVPGQTGAQGPTGPQGPPGVTPIQTATSAMHAFGDVNGTVPFFTVPEGQTFVLTDVLAVFSSYDDSGLVFTGDIYENNIVQFTFVFTNDSPVQSVHFNSGIPFTQGTQVNVMANCTENVSLLLSGYYMTDNN